MVTIAHLTEKLVSEKPFLQEALYRKIVNYHGLAEELQPEIEALLQEKVKLSAIAIALHRYAEKLGETYVKKINWGPQAHLSMKSEIIEISVKKTNSVFYLLPKMFESVNFEEGGTLNFINGNYDVSIVTNSQYKKRFLELLENEEIIEVNDNLVALSFRYAPELRRTPGLLHQMIRLLAWENINILELVETMAESIFILSEDDSLRAFKQLHKLIEEKSEEKK